MGHDRPSGAGFGVKEDLMVNDRDIRLNATGDISTNKMAMGSTKNHFDYRWQCR